MSTSTSYSNLIIRCERYGKLYAYFLAVAKEVIYNKLRRIGFPNEGKAMYDYLHKQICRTAINNNEYLTKPQKEVLLPKDKVIKVKSLDVALYAKIIILLGREEKFMKFLINKRNYLCHLSLDKLEKDLTDEDFEKDWNMATRYFKAFNVDRELLKRCRMDIFEK